MPHQMPQNSAMSSTPNMLPNIAGMDFDDHMKRSLAELDAERQHIVTFLSQQNGDVMAKIQLVRENMPGARAEYCTKVLDERALQAIQELPIESQAEIYSDINVLKCR